MKRFLLFVVLMIILGESSALEPPRNLVAESGNGYVTLNWQPPVQDSMYVFFYHNGIPHGGYYQSFNNGYGVIFDLSDYEGCTLSKLDFRHSSYGIIGTNEYNIHIIDWLQQQEIGSVNDLHTTVIDSWEQDIDLGEIASTSQVGVFIEPLGHTYDNAYPVVDYDTSLDAASYVINLNNMNILTPNGAAGDFLIDLWITPTTGTAYRAPRLTFPSVNAHRDTNACTQRIRETNPFPLTRNPTGYRVYRDGTLLTTDLIDYHVLTYSDNDVTNAQTYTYWVTAMYSEGESEASDTVQVTVQFDPFQLFFDSFEEESISADWTRYDIDGDGFEWDIAPAGISAYEGSHCIRSESYANSTGSILTPDNWIISPAVSLSQDSFLKFWVATQDSGWPAEHYQVLLSTTGIDVDDFDTVLMDETLSSANVVWSQVVIPLSPWTGTTCHFAWRHCNCTNNYVMKIDNVEITTNDNTNIDVTPTQIVFDGVYPGQAPSIATVTIHNEGNGVLAINGLSFADGSQGFSVVEPSIPSYVALDDSLVVLLAFNPCTTGYLADTFQIISNASNACTVNVALCGTSLSAEPSAPQNVQVQTQGNDVVLSWDAVTTNVEGVPIVPTGYIVQYSENPNPGTDDYAYLAFTTEPAYTHQQVLLSNCLMFYRVLTVIQAGTMRLPDVTQRTMPIR